MKTATFSKKLHTKKKISWDRINGKQKMGHMNQNYCQWGCGIAENLKFLKHWFTCPIFSNLKNETLKH